MNKSDSVWTSKGKNEELESLKKKVEELKVLLAKAKVMIGTQVLNRFGV